MLQYHSKRTNTLYCDYFAGSFIHCRKYFAVLIIRCTKTFAKFIFIALNDYESILTTKISRFTVCSPASGLNTKGNWEITGVREDSDIYPGYAQRFHQTFPAQVCVALKFDALNKRSCCD